MSNAGVGSGAAGKAAVAVGAAMVVLVLTLNLPGNALVELRHHRVAGMLLSHASMVFLTVPFWPALSRILPKALRIAGARLVRWLAIVVLGSVGCMLLLIAAWPDYAHQLLTREWGIIEPLQFVLYLLASKLCFTIAASEVGRTAWVRLYSLGGWLARLSALEEIDYLSVLSSIVRLAGAEGARIGRSYVGGVHDLLNVAAQYGLLWMAAPVLGLGALAIAWWTSAGHAAAIKQMVSWRLAPALVGGSFMVFAQISDISGDVLGGTLGGWLNDFLEEPVELLAIVFLNVTLMLELANLTSRDEQSPAPLMATR